MIATSSVSIVNVNDGATGATGPQGVSVTKVVEEYRLSNSSTELTGSGTGYTWSETKPDIPSGKYLWIRERTDLSNNTSSYGTAHCDIVISGLVQDVDRNSNAITSKVWESDITTKINEYDGSTGAAIRNRVSQTETNISGITSRVSDVESETDSLGTRMTSAESSITQNANNIALKVSQDGVISSINQSPETIKISASKVNIEGAVTFSSFDSTLQNRLTTAESDASTAKSDASSAVSTANTASSNASSALTKVNNSIKSTTMHYLATSASSGVTTSTSGWTTTIQSITKDKPYLWTYQTVTKINDTTSNTDPVISGVYGATGGKGDTGTGVTKVEQLYRTSNSTTAPAAPTSAVSSTSTSYNTWTLAMPTYNTSYPYYYICTQTTYDNGTVKWTTVSRSKALEDANSTANTANTNASNAVSTANTANTNASNAVSTANTANTNASNAVTTANQAKSKADSAASLLSTWTGDATLATTTINGGYIKTHTIKSTHLATNAIMSQNYTGLDNSHFSSEGSYLDLSTGNFYTPKFGVSAEGQGGAYINGEVVATSGRFGNDTSYWNIATVYDYNSQPHASLVGTGSPYLQTGNWQVSDNAVATRKYTSTSESAGNATYYKDSDTNTFYDVGMKIPTDFSSTAATNDVGRYNKAFYYGRKYTGNNPPTVEGNWVYFYMLDTSGNLKTAGTITTGGDIYEGGTKLSEKYAAISDVGSVYLPKTGGTITGNLTVNGSFTTNLQVQTNLASTSAAQLTGNANATVTHGVTGTLGVGNGGTGKSSWTANQIVYASASNTLSQLGSGTSGQILKSNGSSAPSWVNQSTLSVGSATKATQDGNGNVIVNTYMPIAGGQFTGAVYVPDEFSADSAQLGSLIVNGAARFTNDVFADTFTGNLVGTASNAVKVGNNLVIKLNGGSTEGTNLFTYNGSAAKTINITASSIGAQASGTYAGGISNGGAASKLAYQAGNEINFVSTADTPPNAVYFNYRNGYTNAKTGVSSDYSYFFDNGNAEYNHTTLYAAQFSGNAATATKLANARTITLSGSVTGSTTFDGSGNVTIATTTNHTHNYAGSSSAGGSANTVAGEAGSVNSARHVWFSDSSTETKRNYDDDFKYNPSTNVLTVGSITGNAATATKVNKSLKMANNKSFDGSADVNLFTNDLIPAISKTYTSTAYYSTDNSWDNSSWYFMSVKPDSWYKTWRVKFKIRSYCPSYTNVDSTSWVEVYGRASSPSSYKIYNEFYDRGHYYVNVYPLTQSGFNAGYGHAIGVSIRYAYNYSYSAYYRTFDVDYYECDGCTVSLLDTPVKWESWIGTGTTNYGSFSYFDAASRGLQETGDNNNYDILQMSTNYMYNGNTMRMPGYTLMGIDRSGNAQAISLYSANYESTTVSINTARVYNTAGFDWTQGIYYFTSGTNFAKSAVLQTSLRLAYTALDFRYTDNNVASSTANNLGMVSYKPVYFRGVIKNDGLFYLAPISVTYDNKTYQRAWTQDIPTSVETDGTYQYVYWFLGYPYYNSSYANSQYQLNLFSENKMYWYHNNRFEEYVQESAYSDRANHANVTSTANAVAYYTDTKGTFGSKASANGALYATSANGALQWGTLPVAQGGTGLTASPSILVNLASTSATNVMAASPRPGVTGTLPIANGGTGATTADGIKTNLSLNNVTNNKQVKGLASGTTSGHLVSWGSDGYTVADSGITTSGVNKTVTSLASNDDGKIVLTYLDGTTSTPIEVKIIGQSGSSVSYADALNVNGTAVGGSEQPVYINNQGKPATANKIPKLNNTTTGGTFYAPTGVGSANQVLVSSGSGAPTWTTLTKSAIGLGNVVNLDQSKAIKSITKSGGTYTATALDNTSFTFSESVTGVKGSAETSYRTGNVNITPANIGAISKTDELLTTNPFAPTTMKGPYISKIDDAFYAADKRWNVTATNISGSASVLFDGSYESSVQIGNNQTAVITIDFSTESDGYFPGYPYGYFLISFYYICAPKSVSGRAYCNYSAHGIGWHDINFTRVPDGAEGAITYRGYQGNYAISKVEISIVGDNSNSYGYTAVSEIELHLDRPSSSRNPFLSKYSPERLYYDLTAPNFIGNLTGNATSATTATTAGAFTSAKSITLTGDTTGTASSTGGWSLATTTNKLSYQPQLTTQDAIDSFIEASKFMVTTFRTTDANNVGMGSNDGMIMSLAWQNSTNYGAQIALDDNTAGVLKFRSRVSNTWADWRTVLHSGNYTSYTVTKTGTGASGTWDISISGNAATASKLATSRSLWGNSFDGSSNISGHIKLPATNSVIQTLADTSNWGLGLGWDKTTSYTQSYRPGIGFFNLGGNNGNGAISIVPYAQDTAPWGGSVGLFLTQDDIKFNNVSLVKNSGTWGISVTGNAATSTKWASAQTVYVALGTASKTTSIQGGSSSAVTLGVDGVLGVANGGTGAASFTANSVIMSGSSTTGAFTTRAVTNNTSASAVTANTNLITANTLAYWTGSSNLTTCSQGTFGTMASASASDYLKLSGGTMTGTIITTPNTLSMNFRNYNSYNTGFYYGTTGNEALTVALQNSVTSFMIKHGTDPSSYNSGTWNTGVPTLQAKKNSVYINELIPSGTDPTYKFKVNGISALKGGTDLFDSASDNTHANVSYDSTLQAIVFSFA